MASWTRVKRTNHGVILIVNRYNDRAESRANIRILPPLANNESMEVASSEAVRSSSSISLGTIHWLSCRVFSGDEQRIESGWKMRMERQEGNENASLKKCVAIYFDAKDSHLHSKNSLENVRLDISVEPPFSSRKKIF